MRLIAVAAAALGLMAGSASAADPAPAAPAQHPDWNASSERAAEMIAGGLFDPESAVVEWTSGFQWGYVKEPLRRRSFVWIACASVNGRNRFGGYVGAKPYIAWIEPNGELHTSSADLFISTCDQASLAPAGPEMVGLSPRDSAAVVSPADELTKLAGLRDRGVLTADEFEQQKARLLSR